MLLLILYIVVTRYDVYENFTSDLIIVDDGAGGTNKKAALSRLITLVDANAGFATKGFATAMAIAL